MTTTADFAEFIQSTSYEDMSEDIREEVKRRILDALGIAFGAVGHDPVEVVHDTVEDLNPNGGDCTVMCSDITASPSDAAMRNTTLIRFLDYMDAIPLTHDAPHPDDCIGAAIATAEYNSKSGKELIAGVATGYEIHGEFAAEAPSGYHWDQPHVIFSNTSVASKLMDLNFEETQSAIGTAAAEYNQLRIIREGQISSWKGLASGNRARNAVHMAIMAKNGLDGVDDALEGKWGWKEVIHTKDCHPNFAMGKWIPRVLTKKYMLGTHAQSACEGLEELMEQESIDASDIEEINVETYARAILSMGNRPLPETRETADHSIEYGMAALALDGKLMHEQYTEDRLQSDDIRELFQNINVEENTELTRLYEKGKDVMPYNITIVTKDGEEHYIEKRSFEGNPDNPMSWDQIEDKFHMLSEDVYDSSHRDDIVEVVKNLEKYETSDLTALL